MFGKVRVFGGSDVELVRAAGEIVIIARREKKAHPFGWVSMNDRIWRPSDIESSSALYNADAIPSQKHPRAAYRAACRSEHVRLLIKTPAAWQGLVEQAERSVRFVDRTAPKTRAVIRAFLEAAKRYKRAVREELENRNAA